MASGIVLKAKAEGFNKVQRELKQTGKAARGMGAGVGAAGAAMGSMAAAINPVTAALAVAAAGFAAAAVAVKLTKDAFVGTIKATLKMADALDEIGKKAKSIGGVSGEGLQVVIGAMELAGVESAATMKSLQKLNQSMGEGLRGTKSYTDAFDQLGISAEAMASMPLEERLLAFSAGLEKMGTRAEQAQVGALLMGRAFKDMIVGLEDRDALQGLMEDIQGFGVASNEAIQDSEDLKDAILRMEKAAFGLKSEALAPMIPVLTGVAQGFANILAELDRDKVDAYGGAMADLTEDIVVALMSTGPAIEFALKGIGLLSKIGLVTASAVTTTIDRLTWWKGMLGAGEISGLDDSASRWTSWGEEVIEAIRVARTEAQGPITQLLPTPEGFYIGADGEAYRIGEGPRGKRKPKPPPRGGGGTGGGKAGKAADPLAGLKRELEALRRNLLDKEQVLREAKDREIQLTKDGVAAELLTRRDGKIQELAIQAAFDDEMMAMAQAQADAIDALNAKAAAKEAARMQVQRTQAIQVVESVGAFAGAISSIITSLSDEQNEEAKKAAKVFFGIQQATALGLAIMYMAESIAAANKLGFPANIPAMAAAAAVGGAQIATITATTIQGLAHAGLPPDALAGSGSNEATIMMRRDEMILDPVGTKAISQMLSQRTQGGQPIQVNTTLEIDGDVLGRTVDTHLVRSAERGIGYQDRIRY